MATAPTVVIDEAWVREWIEYGFRDLARYLERHAAFAQYLKRHGRA